MTRLLLTLLVGALMLVSAPTGAWAQTCDTEIPGLGIQLLEAPAHLADLPRAQVAIFDELSPGATIERRIRFSNGDPSEPLPLAVYATAADVAGGQFVVSDGQVDNELTGWTSIDRSTLTLPPCSHDEVTVTISVPADADGGERYALVAAEHRPEGDGITVASRIGVRAYLQVAGPGAARTDLDLVTFTPGRDEAGRPTLTVELHNPGDRAVDVALEAELDQGPGDARAGPFPGDGTPTLAPGETHHVTITLPEGLPGGPWRARVTARTGEIERRAEAQVAFPQAGQGEPVAASPWEDRRLLLPLAGLLLTLAILLLLIAWRRRRRDDDESNGDEHGEVAAEPVGVG